MADIEHRNIPDSELHEPKGASTALVGQVYTSDGAGSGSWQIPPSVDPTNISINRLIDAESVAASQEPTGTGEANAIQVEFGPALNTASDKVQLLADGTLRFNQAGLYRIKITLMYGRTGGAGVSELRFRVLVAGTQAGRALQQQDLANILNLQQADIGAAQAQQLLQQGALGLGTGLLSTGYMPQQQALALLEASRIPAQLQQTGQLAGAQLQSQLGGRGIESLLQGTQLSQEAQLAMNQSLMQALAGRQGLAGEFTGGLLGGIVQPAIEALPSWLSGLFSSRPDYDAMSDEEREQAMYDIFN